MSQSSLSARLYTACALVLPVTLTLAVFAITRVDSIETTLPNAQAFRSARLEPLYEAREALDQTGIAARNACIFQDPQAAATELDIVDARKAEYLAALARVAGSMKQLIGSVRRNAEYAAQASAAVEGVVATMNPIQDSSRKIEEIIAVIDSIAYRTNILALNAAVEAARAGEQGRGFAVVAGEVRNLAHRPACAAREIKVLIEDSVSKVGAGAVLVAAAGDTMRRVVSGVQRVSGIMGEISSATLSQSEDIEQVDAAIVRLDDMTLQNAARVEEASAAAQSLRVQADELAAVVNTFQLEGPAGSARGLRQAPASASRVGAAWLPAA